MRVCPSIRAARARKYVGLLCVAREKRFVRLFCRAVRGIRVSLDFGSVHDAFHAVASEKVGWRSVETSTVGHTRQGSPWRKKKNQDGD